MKNFIGEINMTMEECCTCHIMFAVSKEFKAKRRQDHEIFYCPLGHQQFYAELSDKEQLEQKLASQTECCIQAQEKAIALERKVWGMKGAYTKLRKAVKK